MKRIWSPWRSQHLRHWKSSLEKGNRHESVFTTLAREDNDEKNLIVWRGNTVFVIMNLYPYNNGHLMIVPHRQVTEYEELTPEEQIEIAHTIDHCIRWLKRALEPEGFNIGMNLGTAGGAGIPDHLHVHVVPRWSADTNFMTTAGELKVIPEALIDTYNRLRQIITEEPPELPE